MKAKRHVGEEEVEEEEDEEDERDEAKKKKQVLILNTYVHSTQNRVTGSPSTTDLPDGAGLSINKKSVI